MIAGRLQAGRLDRRLRFDSPKQVSDGAGNYTDGWEEQFSVAANRKWLRGGESVLAARLESRQPAIITIRNSTDARRITADWRCVDVRDGRQYAIRENPKESDNGGYLEFLVEAGVAQ